MFRHILPKILFLLAAAAWAPEWRAAGNSCGAAEFDIDGPRTLLRRLQYCRDCGSALLVTRVHPGTIVRCPDCGAEQPRIQDRFLLTQLYQLCRLCASPLDATGHAPGETVACGVCRTAQILSRDAFPSGDAASGPGYMPGFPPGSGKKTLLLSPNRADGLITTIPLDDDGDSPPPPASDPALVIPRPAAPLPTASAESVPPGATDAIATLDPTTPAPDIAAPTALTVPAVTADLFGGVVPSSAAGSTGAAVDGAIAVLVDGQPIYAAEVARVLNPVLARLREAAGPGGDAAVAAREPALRREVTERLVDRELAVREAAATGHRPDPAAVRRREADLASVLGGSAADIRREAERDVVMNDMRRRFSERPATASPEAVRDYYRRHRDEMLQPRLLALDSLVIYEDRAGRADRRNHRDIAMEVSRAFEGGASFDAARRQYDEFAAAAGTDAPEPALLPESAYSAAILEAAGDLRRGAIFGPLFLDGMAVFGKVADERPAGPVPFESVEKEIRARLESEATEKGLDAWLRGLRKKARIEYILPSEAGQ